MNISDWGRIYRNKDALYLGDQFRIVLRDGEVETSASVVAKGGDCTIFLFDSVHWLHNMDDASVPCDTFTESDLADYLDETIFSELPDDLRAIIRPQQISQLTEGCIWDRTSYLWLPSFSEIFEGGFFLGASGAKAGIGYWTRTPLRHGDFVGVDEKGGCSFWYQTDLRGVRPCFTI